MNDFATVADFPALVEGSGPPVVFLHGAFADHTCFGGWVHRFATRGHTAIAASRRGRLGVGPDRAEGLTFDDYVADTVAVLDTLEEPAVLVGHSLGGLIAQRLAEQGRAAAVVLLCSAPPSMLTAQSIGLRYFGPLMPGIMRGRPVIVPDNACSILALNCMPEEARPAIHAALVHESGRVYRSLMMGKVRVDAERVTVPVRVIGASEDRIVSPKLVRSTARHYGVEAEVLDGRGHFVIVEPGWEGICDDVIDWVGTASRASSGRGGLPAPTPC